MAYMLMSQGFETRVKVWKAEWVNDADTPSSTPGTPTSTKKGQREMGPEGRAWSKVVVTVGHRAQGPTKGSSRNPYHSAGDKSAASATSVPLLTLISCSECALCSSISSNPALLSSTETLSFWPAQAKVLFPYSQVPQSLLYVLLIHSYLLMHLFINFLNYNLPRTIPGSFIW